MQQSLNKHCFVDTFLAFSSVPPAQPQKITKMTSPSPSGTLPGTLQEGEIDPLFAPRAFQGRQDQFLGRPGPCQSLSGMAPGSVWKQGRGPRAAQRLPGTHFGAIWCYLSRFGSM